MNGSSYRVRRATVDDLPKLGPLLRATLLPVADLEKRFTEFQVVEDAASGELIGALGLQVVQKQGKIHNETYSDFGLADTLRPMLWERLQNVATNYGLFRLWTEETAPFWKQQGFGPVPADLKTPAPPEMGERSNTWLTLKLREDPEQVLSLDKEFAVFMEAEKARTEEMYSQAKLIKGLAYFLAVALLLAVLAGAFLLLRRGPPVGWK